MGTIGCRQANPDWLGRVSETAAHFGTDTGSASESSSGTSIDGPYCEYEGAACEVGEVCGPDGCQWGIEGDACEDDMHCSQEAPLCGPDGTCQDGDLGDPCISDRECHDPLTCDEDGSCRAGEGQACAGDDDCHDDAPVCSSTALCQDGSEGDPCTDDDDCREGLGNCGPDGLCSPGFSGDLCEDDGDCFFWLNCDQNVCS